MSIFTRIGRGIGKAIKKGGKWVIKNGKRVYKRPISIFKGAIKVVVDPKAAAKDVLWNIKHPGALIKRGTKILVNDVKGRVKLVASVSTTAVKAGQTLGKGLVKISDAALVIVDGVQQSMGSFLRSYLPGFDAVWAYANEWTPLGQITSRYAAIQKIQRLIAHGEIPDKRFILSSISPKIAKMYDKLDKIVLVTGDARRVYKETNNGGDYRGTVLQHA